MNKQLSLESVTMEELTHPAFVLAGLRVFNWGSFQRLHEAVIDPQGTAIIGPTGSGKTTLVDALMTLLCPQPRYNLASTGGHESDRDLMSYVRGVAGSGDGSGGTDHISRPGKTITALEACFVSGQRRLYLGGLLWLDSASNAMADLKRLWVFSENDEFTLEEWLQAHQDGGMRTLKQRAKQLSGVSVWESKKSYLVQARRYFDVSDNAFVLLNRASGLKQINSIDELFRELVLDDCSAFARAAEVVSEFDDLTDIHNELQTARRQQQSLLPVETEQNRVIADRQERSQHKQLLEVLPRWYAEHGHALWSEVKRDKDIEYGRQLRRKEALDTRIDQQATQVESLHEAYLRVGGSSIEDMEGRIDEQQQKLATVKRHAEDYQRMATTLDLNAPDSSAAFTDNQQKITQLLTNKKAEQETSEAKLFEQGAELQNLTEQLQELEQEKAKIAASDSNIPGQFLSFRQELAQVLGRDMDELPFAAELVEVKSEESAWRGAIERAFGPHRLRMLVPASDMRKASAWVNNRNNRLHVRLLEVFDSYGQARFLDDGFTRKLNYKSHPAREAVKHLLSGIDRHCKNSSDELQGEAHAMTREGLMTGQRGFYDKQDQRPLNKDWMTGFDNRDRLRSLQEDIDGLKTQQQEQKQKLEQVRQQRSQRQSAIEMLVLLEKVHFSDIDVSSVENSLNALKQRLAAALQPDSDTAGAKAAWDAAKQALSQLQKNSEILSRDIGGIREQSEDAGKRAADCYQRIGEGLTEEERALADEHFSQPTLDSLERVERQQREAMEKTLADLEQRISQSEQKLARYMVQAQQADTGALAETGTELEDIPAYLERLRILTEEDLPEKLQRFLNYLNQSSDQGVTQLLMSVGNEVDRIRERIDDLNSTMRRVDFKPQMYIRLDPKDIVHESLKSLQQAQRRLRLAITQDDQGDSHYKALQQVVEMLRDACERRRTHGAQALLDPRYRLEFSASVIRREDGTVVESLKGSQGGSGGEKEIIASYILTASLSYALCPDGLPRPLFSTVVLDEAFSRSSQAVAGRIIAALREFGLHPLFVTPNKEIKLLRAHTRSAVLVHNQAGSSCIACISWEELDAQARQQRD